MSDKTEYMNAMPSVKKMLLAFASMICLLNACGINNSSSKRGGGDSDSLYVLVQERDDSDIYQLIRRQNKKTEKVLEFEFFDESSLAFLYNYQDNELDYECFSLNNNGADCNEFIFFDKKSELFYITKVCFSGFYPRKSGLDFAKQALILDNSYSDGFEEVEWNDSILYAPYNDSIKSIKSSLIQMNNEIK